ncbi:hypothetical protein HDU98_007009 [Podochytrium sp. JEL0797]|nr:hypothetical protein HDU98_007009 [Podochytrium sp. JEL0797]
MASPSTALLEIPLIASELRKTFNNNTTKPIAWRKQQLHSLLQALSNQEYKLVDALQKDLGLSWQEAVTEIQTVREATYNALGHLSEWTKVQTQTSLLATRSQLSREPVGLVAIFTPWYSPVAQLLLPVIQAIAAGNCVIAQTSIIAPQTEALFSDWFPQIFDSSAIALIVGGATETTRILEQKLDHVYFKGSKSDAKTVSTACAKALIPVTLEVRSKCPVYVHKDANVDVVARRLAVAKSLRSGQVADSPDFVLVHKSVKAKFVTSLTKQYTALFEKSPRTFGRIVNYNHSHDLIRKLQRQTAMAHSKIEYGGNCNIDQCYVKPTIVSGAKMSDPLLADDEPVFGPVLAVVEVGSEEEAFKIIQSREKTAAVYVCTQSRAIVTQFSKLSTCESIYVNDFTFPDAASPKPDLLASKTNGRDGFNVFTRERNLIARQTIPLSDSRRTLAATTIRSKMARLPVQFLYFFFKRVLPKLFEYVKLWILFKAGEMAGKVGWEKLVANGKKALEIAYSYV